MPTVAAVATFLRSKSWRAFQAYLLLCFVLSAAVGYGSYRSNLNWFKQHKSEEKITALQLVDAFVTTYSAVRSRFGTDAPVPATFRAHSIERFNQQSGFDSDFRLRWVGRPGREIVSAPADPIMADAVEAFAGVANPKPLAEFLTVDDQRVFRTVYPSLAREQSCVDCHNALQPDKPKWQLNDVMGAFVIDIPIGSFLQSILREGIVLGLGIFIVLAAVGLAFFVLHFRQISEREAAELTLGRRVEERTSELRAAQAELIGKERLVTIGQVTATVAHELRNPLSAIRNTVFSIKEVIKRGALDLERPMARVERNIGRCDRIISVLLDYTRSREIKCTPVELDAWLNEVLKAQPIPDGIRLVLLLSAPNCLLSLDAGQMRRAVLNLLENSLQAFADGGHDADKERQITLSTRIVGDFCELAVEDTGPGIPEEILPRVFEPLFSTKSFGTGLGLPIVKQIVHQHKSSIKISSGPLKGTRAVIRIPLAESQRMAA
jgi:signal transduction histidine kinase